MKGIFGKEGRSNSVNMVKNILILLFTGWLPLLSQGFEARIYEAYVEGDMDRWLQVMNGMEDLWETTGSDKLLYELVVARYGYIAYLISEDRKKEARDQVKQAESELERLLEKYPDMARAHAFLGAIYGYKVGLDPYKAVVYGRRAFSENNVAFALDPDDPQVWMEKGNIELYKPAVFGSNSLEAARIYRKAIELYEKDTIDLEYNWMYINTMRSLTDAYIEAGEYTRANEVFLKIMRVEPRLKWMREEVYPAFRSKYGF